MRDEIKMEKTAFLAPQQSIWAVRQAVKAALRDEMQEQRFIVTYEELYYADALDDILFDAHGLAKVSMALCDKITGEVDGAWRCAALWSLSSWTGVLLHRQGTELLCAYIPLLNRATADLEHSVSVALAMMAQEVQDLPIRLERGIAEGQYQLSALLELLSESLESQ